MTFGAGSRLGPYELLGLLGKGGMGEVYRARDTRLNRDVAIKILPPGVTDDPVRRARFAREGQTISQLTHPHISAIYDVGEEDGVAYLVMEFIDGESLERRLLHGPVPWPTALPWAIQIAAAIDAAHRRGIVHRDLKPANVMVTESGIKLLDFGVAKLVEQTDAAIEASAAASTASLTAEQRIVGTLHYMSPEQLEGRDVDTRTDIFAFGVTLYEMLSGAKAFDGTSAASVSAAILTSEPAPLMASASGSRDVPPALDHIVRRALAKQPDERWQTARDVMLELRSVQEGRTTAPVLLRRSRRQARLLGVAAAGAALVASGLAIGWALGAAARPATSPEPIVFSVTAPEGTRLFTGNGAMALSPDGRKLAFIAGPEGGPDRIWMREVGSPMARPLVGSEGPNGPFWSPDSRSIGFFAESFGTIRRVDIQTGASATIVTLPPTGGLATSRVPAALWRADGTIVFGGSSLYRVDVSGGAITPLATADNAKGERTFLFPATFPGDRLMHAVRKRSNELAETHIRRMDGALVKIVPRVGSNAAFADGHLIFRRDDALVAEPFDESRLASTGPPIVLADGVQFNPANDRTGFDVARDVLAYRPRILQKLVWKDREGRITGTLSEHGRDWNPAMARDGSGRVAIDRYEPEGRRFNIWTIDERGQATALTHTGARFAAWSPDGQWIAYVAVGPAGAELRRSRTDGSGSEQPLSLGTQFIPHDWSSDGKYLVYEDGAPANLWALPLEGDRTPIRLTESPWRKQAGRISPDGKWIAYTSMEGGVENVWVQEFPRANSPYKVSTKGGWDPNWRADQRELFYMAFDGSLVAVPIAPGPTWKAGPPKELFKTDARQLPAVVHHYAASPDGQRFLVPGPFAAPDSITVVVNWQWLLK